MKLVWSSLVLGFAWFTVANLVMSAAAWLAAHVVLSSKQSPSGGGLLAIRLMPAAVASIVVVGVFLPGHVRFEPVTVDESFGVFLPLLALGAIALLAHTLIRLISVAGAAASVRELPSRRLGGLPEVYQVTGFSGISIAGVLRTRILVGARAHAALSEAELEAAVAHEAAHRSFHDNLTRCAMYCAPDFFGLTALAARLEARWRAEAECRADAAAVGRDYARALHLASALIKVARLEQVRAAASECPAWSSFCEPGLLEMRVRRLVTGAPPRPGAGAPVALLLLATVPASLWAAGAPYHLHRLTELLVSRLP